MTDAPTYQDRTTGRVYRDATDMVNDYLQRFGEQVGVGLSTLDEEGFTDIRHGSATIGINVLEDRGVLLLLARVGAVPSENRETFFQHLLELNFLVTSDAAFALDRGGEAVYLRALRRLGGLDYEELDDLLHTIASLADEWDDRLAALARGETADEV